MCVTHGDTTGRNIMVDQTGRCWMIGFLRNYESHSLRDFVILETDLKYRQVSQLPHGEYSVVMLVRNFARQVAFGVANPSQIDYEYSVSLLMATLNVVRLRDIPPARKMQALKAAIMICETLGD